MKSDIQHWRYDLVVEATGSPSGFELARKALRPRGTLVLKSTYKGDMTVNFSSIVVDEIQLIGSRCGPFEPALTPAGNGKRLTQHCLLLRNIRLRDGLKAFEEAEKTGDVESAADTVKNRGRFNNLPRLLFFR